MSNTAKRKARVAKAEAMVRGSVGEPTVTQENYRIELMNAFNWYNTEDIKVVRKYADHYVTSVLKQKDLTHCLSKAYEFEMKQVGVIGRLLARGQYVSDEHKQKMHDRLQELKSRYPKQQAVKEVATTPVSAPMTVQERIQESALKYAGELDEQIDVFVKEKASTFSTKTYLLSNTISGAVAKRIGERYQPLLKELQEAAKGKDEQLVEGYSYLTASQLKKFIAFVQSIVSDCTQQTVTARAQRKPRARKVKSPSIIVSKMKYMKEFVDLKLKSIDPAKIIGASELWVYAPATRKLTVFVGNSELGVSGMSITNYDVEKTQTKTLRKPDEFFKGLTSTGKRAMANAWKSVRAKVSKPRARINEEMILLAAN